MRFLVTIVLFFFYSAAFAADKDVAELRAAVGRLNQALLQKDSMTLKALLHKEVSYGHSNGWIESKRAVIENLYNGKLVYHKIDQVTGSITVEENAVAVVRSEAGINVSLHGKEIIMKLHILQVWVKKETGWQLLSRQSVKIG